MNYSPSAKRLNILMADIVPLYSDFVEHLQQGHDASIEVFQQLFDRHHMEYLHYCGSSIAVPFLLDVERDLLQLAAAYLSFPQKILLPKVRLFSLLLLFFFYGTQPLIDNQDLPPFPIVISADVFDSLFSHPPSSGTLLDSSLAVPPSPNTTGLGSLSLEEQIVLSFYARNAFSIQPSVDNKAYVAALLRAHELTRKAPIFNLELQKKSSPASSFPYTPASAYSIGSLHNYGLPEKLQYIGDNHLKKMLRNYHEKWEKNKDLLQ